MSQKQRQSQESEFEDLGDMTAEGVVDRIARLTLPGKENGYFADNMADVGDVVGSFVDDTNDWFEVLDVRVYRDKKIGIPARFRWTIKRWVVNDMDSWLMDNGWERIAHLKADSRKHEENEMEARYRKEFGDWLVHANFYVEFTEDVFEALNDSRAVLEAKRSNEREEYVREIAEKKRGGE